MSVSHSRPRVFALVVLLIAFVAKASAQVNEAQLISKLTGAAAAPKIVLGDEGKFVSSETISHPVITKIYPNGDFRYEVVSIFGPVVASEYSTFSFQAFEIGGVSLKKDNLTITLVSILHPEKSATVRIMFDKGWQTKMSNQAVLDEVEKTLTITNSDSS